VQVNHDGLLRVVHILEDSLAVLIKGSRCDDSRHIGSGHSDAVIQAACYFWVGADTSNVYDLYFETALECPNFVRAPNVQAQFAIRYEQIHHEDAPVS
jgi:hypothetical protein